MPRRPRPGRPVPETQDNITKAREALVAAAATKAQAVGVEAKEVVSDAQANAREAMAAVAAKMQSTTAEVKGAISEVQARVAKARKVVKAESGAAKAKTESIRRAAIAEARGALAEAQEKFAKVMKAVKGPGVQYPSEASNGCALRRSHRYGY